jgi:hypothetical protein
MATVKLALTTMIGLRDCRDVLGSQARTGGVDDLLVDSGGCFSFLARWYRVYAGPLTGCYCISNTAERREAGEVAREWAVAREG